MVMWQPIAWRRWKLANDKVRADCHVSGKYYGAAYTHGKLNAKQEFHHLYH